MAEQHGANFGATEREAEVAGGARVNRIYCEAAGLVGRLRQEVCLERHEMKIRQDVDSVTALGKPEVGLET
jgi:hypothetical protein